MKNFLFRLFVFITGVLTSFTSAYAHYCVVHVYGEYYTCNPNSAIDVLQLKNMFFNIRPAAGDTIAYQGSPVICSGGQLTLTLANAGANSSVQWFKDPSGSPIATTATYVVTSAGTYKAIVTTNGVTYAYPSLTIAAGVNPVAGFTFPAGMPCSSVPIQFTNTSAGKSLSYSWDFGDPNSKKLNNSTDSNPVHLFVGNPGNGTQTFTVTLTVMSAAGCSSIYQSSITLEQSPDTNLGGTGSITYNAKPYFVSCTNAPTSFTFINQSTTNNISYTIFWGDGAVQKTVANFTTVTHTYRVGSFIMAYTVYGKNGCSRSTKYRIFVGTSPKVALSIAANTLSVCAGSTMVVPVINNKTNTPGTTYLVSYNDGTINNYTSPPDTIMHTFLTSSTNLNSTRQGHIFTNSYSAIITASNPCGSAADTIAPIYVSDIPKSSFVNNNSNITCAGSPVGFANTSPVQYYNSASGTQVNSFVWKVIPATGYQANAGNMGDDKGSINPSLWVQGKNNLNITFTNPGNYKVILETGNPQCGIDTVFENICVNPMPVSSFNIDNTQGCGPLVVHTSNTSNLPVCGSNIYQWNVSYSNDGCSNDASDFSFVGTSTSTSENPVIQFNNPGIYTLTLTNSNTASGCISAAFSQNIVISAKPVVSMQIPDIVYKDQSIKPAAIVGSCFSTNEPSYVWTFYGGSPATSTALNPDSILFSILGKYTISLTVTNDCGVTVVSKTINVVTKPTMFIPNTFTPNGDGINDTWEIKGLDSEPSLVNVFNRYGSLIFQSQGLYKPWNGLYNGKRLPMGVYYYVINTATTKKTLTGWISIIY